MNRITSKCAILAAFSAIIAFSACVGETKKGSDTDSTATDVVEEDKGSQFTLEHFTYSDSCEFAYVDFDIELPTDRTDVATKIRTILYNKLVETCSEHIDKKISPYKDGNLVDIAQYCGVAVFDKLAEDSQTQYLVMTAEQRENGEDESSYETYKMPYDCNNRMGLEYENDNIVVFYFASEIFLGGAHGSHFITYYTFNARTGDLITNILDRDKTRAMQPLLWAGVKEYFKGDNPNITDNEINEQLFINGSLIPIPSIEPLPSEDGLTIIYPSYEIACYAAGIVSFKIPYDKVKPYMTDKAKKEMGIK